MIKFSEIPFSLRYL